MAIGWVERRANRVYQAAARHPNSEVLQLLVAGIGGEISTWRRDRYLYWHMLGRDKVERLVEMAWPYMTASQKRQWLKSTGKQYGRQE